MSYTTGTKITKRQRRLLGQEGLDIKSPAEVTFKSHFKMGRIEPLTNNQDLMMRAYDNGSNMLLHGMAGTGKTFLAMYKALTDVMAGDTQYKKVIIVRSAVATRSIGFLPGSSEEKMGVFEAPYIAICTELFGRGDAYAILKSKGIIEFVPTSFIRGITINNAIIILDEVNNCTFHEIDTVITRPGQDCRLLICGDMRQSDLTKEEERQGLKDFIRIINKMKSFCHVEFDEDDIVRGPLVKEYLIAKERYFRAK